MPNPVLVLAAYLSLDSAITIGPWKLISASRFEGPWKSEAFEKRSKQLLGRLAGPDGMALANPTLVVRVSDGANGDPPSVGELNALQLALDFGAICKNPEWGTEDAESFSFRVVTTDNTEIHCWPINIETGFFAFDTGLLNQTLHGGWKLDEKEPLVRCPLELVIPSRTMIDEPVASALYEVITLRTEPSNDIEVGRLRTALGWWSKAWRNTPSLGWEDRIVMLKTAFEALVAESRSRKAAELIENRLKDVAIAAAIHADDVDHLLWSPAEAPRLTRTWSQGGVQRSEVVTDFVHWFCAFSDARNGIVHEGRVPDGLEYAETTKYAGPLFHSADRVFRESIRLILHSYGHPDLWRTENGRLAVRLADSLRRDLQEENRNARSETGDA